ncbi:MAG: methyl-accepting chemotaxis protein [Desulfobacterium sp.]
MMFLSIFGVRAKISGGFMLVLLIALVIGVTGYLSLNKVIKDAEVNSLALSVEAKLFEARSHEKNYIHRNDEQFYNKLVGVLDEFGNLLPELKEKSDSKQGAEIEKLHRLKENYLQAAAEMKHAVEENALVLKNLQATGGKIAEISDQETQKIAADTRANVLQANTQALRNNTFKGITNIVNIGYDVMRFYYNAKFGKEQALDALRNMHFDGSNYYYVVREDLTLVSHGANRKLEGMDFGTIKDKKTGKVFMRDVVNNAIADSRSMTEYYWTKAGMGDAIFPKTTYAKYFKPWGLIICAGVYMDDIEKKAAEMQAVLNKGFNALQEANSIETLVLNARLNALYYFKYKTNGDKVEENISKIKNLKVATSEVKGGADDYLKNFKQWMSNDNHIDNQIEEIEKVTRGGFEASSNLADSAQEGFETSASSGKKTILIFVLAGMLTGLGLALMLPQSITGPIQQAIEGLRSSSDEVASASHQLSSASQQLAEGSSEQAASLEETSSSMEEMSSMTKTNADNANQANDIVKESTTDMIQAQGAMVELVASMGEISKASEETQKIVKTIDEIAFQTNLLALNAAVEAARAGEAGAGFAVVADEVRNLAMRAAVAAKSTADLIEGTVKKVGAGSELVAKTNDAFEQVITGAVKIGELVAEISTASNEQASGIEQVNNVVSEMDKVTQQTAANAEESASASEEMNAQAEQMKSIIAEMISLVGGNTKEKREGYGKLPRSVNLKETSVKPASLIMERSAEKNQ